MDYSEMALRAALGYAKKGWPVLPLHGVRKDGTCTCGKADCASPGKHPRTHHGIKDTTTDPEIIKGWFAKWPESNIGIATGGEQGPIVLDIDGPEGEEALRGKDIPETLTVKTGRGRHLYLLSPDQGMKNRTGMLPKVDIRGDDGYVVAPPSLHQCGSRYEFLNGNQDTPLAPTPSWLEETASAPPLANTPPQNVTAEVVFDPNQEEGENPLLEGERNDRLFREGAAMRRRGATESAIALALREDNRLRCKPPLNDAEVIGIAHSASRYEPSVEVPKAAEVPEAARPLFFTCEDLMNRVFPPIVWVVMGLIVEGLTFLTGDPKCGKTRLMLGIAMDICRGKPVLGKISTTKGKVLFIGYEENLKILQTNVEKLGASENNPVENLIFCDPDIMPTSDNGALDILIDMLEKNRDIRLLVVDTFELLRRKNRGTNIYSDDYRAANELKRIADRYGIAIVAIHHNKKGSLEDPLVGKMSGSHGLSGAADTILSLTSQDGESGGKLTCKGRIIEEKTLHLAKDENGFWVLSDDIPELEMSEERTAIIKVLRETPCLSLSAIAEKTGMKYDNVKQLASKMWQKGQLVRVRPGFYSLPENPAYNGYSVLSPCNDRPQEVTYSTP